MGTWYIDNPESDMLDRRGGGFDTLAEAKEEIRRRVSCSCGAGPFRSKTTQVNHEQGHWR